MVTPDFLLLGGTVISWFMYSIGKVNGLMMGGEHSIFDALTQTQDVVTIVLIASACISFLSGVVKKKEKD